MINIKDFKTKVLDLAFSGKLSIQNLEEDSKFLIASLYNKNKKKKYASFSSEMVNQTIPSNWSWCMTYEAVSLENGIETSSGSYPYLDVKFLRTSRNPSMTNKGVLVNEGCKLILVDGENSGEVFSVKQKGYKGSTLKILNICDAFIDKYIFYFIYSKKEGFRKNKTGAAIPHLDKTLFFETPLPLPPLEEQKRIVDRLDQIFNELDKIDSTQIKLSEIKKMMTSKILKLAIQGKLVEQNNNDGTAVDLLKSTGVNKIEINNENIPFEIPSSWVWCKLSDIGSTNIGLTYHPEDIVDNGTMVIRSSNIIDGRLDYTDKVCVNCEIKENQYLKNNDIVICSRNGSKNLVGKNAIYKGEANKFSFGAFMAVFRTEFYDFVKIYFNTDAFKRYFSSDDSKQINQVTQAILKDSLIPLPPLAEQKRIVAKVNSLLTAIDQSAFNTIDK